MPNGFELCEVQFRILRGQARFFMIIMIKYYKCTHIGRKHYPTPYWTEIVRHMSTQKAVTTEAVNALGEKVQVRLCSTPKKEAADIYEMLGYKKMPFWRKIKVCSTQ